MDLKSSKICSKHFENEDFVGGLEAKMMNKPFQPFRRILIKNAVPTLFLPERYVPRPKHHVESFSMDVNTSVEPYTPDVHGSNIDGQVPHDIDKKDFGSQFDTDDCHNCCLDFKNTGIRSTSAQNQLKH